VIDSKVRDDFIGLDRKIFFNNAAYAPMLKCVKSNIDAYLQEACNLKGGADDQADQFLDQIRSSAALLIGANKSEIGFATNTSYGINLAASGLNLQAGDEVILADNDFPSVPYPFAVLRQRGVVIKFAPSVDDHFSLDEVKKLMTPCTRVLAVSFVQYFNGYRNDIRAIGEFCKNNDIFYVVDTIQGLGACPLNVHDCFIDLLACGGQKWLLSPIGSGFFFLSDHAKRKLISYETGWQGVDWGGQYTDLRHFDLEPYADARRFNLGTYPRLPVWGMAAALKYLLEIGIENIYQHNIALLDQLIEYLKTEEFYAIKSSLDPMHRSSIFSIGSPAGAKLVKFLLSQNFYVVYREGGLRVAVNFYNTGKEISTLIEKLKEFKKSQ
jgi:selenocysteine lyase/cysteine desulfurase